MNYSEIIAAAKLYADRLDAEVNISVPTFVLMAEARINRVLKIGEQTHRIYTKTIKDKEYYTLPPEYNGMRIVQFNSKGVDEKDSIPINLEYATPEHILDLQINPNSRSGNFYTIANNQIQVFPILAENGTLEMIFYRKVPNLSNVTPDNWMSIDNPDIYVSGICAEIELFVKNYEASSLWDNRMTRAIGELKNNDVDKRWTGSTLVMRIE
jgi:hypothetical protein